VSVKAARAPGGLQAEGRRLWREIASQVAADGLEMDARELEMLRSACSEADMLAAITAGLEGEPMTVRGAQGQLVAHPLLSEARRSRAAIAALLKTIGLQDAAEAKPGRGGRTTSTSARAAAFARHRPGRAG
jgi:P27 family predicted phage terminase small subunit